LFLIICLIIYCNSVCTLEASVTKTNSLYV